MMSEIELAPTGAPAGWGDYAEDLAGALSVATAGWLAAQGSFKTRREYQRDLLGVGLDWQPAITKAPSWLPWCRERGIDPLTARRSHVDGWNHVMEAAGITPSGRKRRICAISSWYTYLISEEITERNPAAVAKRPHVDPDASTTTGLSEAEINAVLDMAQADSPRAHALIACLYFGGFRVGSVLSADVGDLGWDQGERALRLHLKGGKVQRKFIEEAGSDALDAYLSTRPDAAGDEPLFITRAGGRLDEPYVWRLLRRLARMAGVASWDQISPHSLRHSHITHALDEGVAKDVVQRTAGHKDGRTTDRYDRARLSRRERSGTALSARRRRYEAEQATAGVTP